MSYVSITITIIDLSLMFSPLLSAFLKMLAVLEANLATRLHH